MKLLLPLLVSVALTGCVSSPNSRCFPRRASVAQERAYQSGYQDGLGDAIKDRYWELRYRHHPEAQDHGDHVTLYPIPVPEHDWHGSRIQPTTRNLQIQQ